MAQKRVPGLFPADVPASRQPFIDLAHLRKCDVRDGRLVYCRHKTGRQITLRIPREALRLIYAYRDDNPSSAYLFPILHTDAGGAVGTEGIIAYTSRLCGVSTGVCVCLPGGFFRASKSARTRRGIPGPRLPSIAVCSSVLSAKHWGTPPCG